MSEIRPIPPFKRFCGMLGAFPEAFSDSMTVYEALEWLYRYIDTEVVPKTNEAIKLAEELKEYVEHYFDNLDVQEEINNKLDDMAESGQLAEIITAYLQVKSVLAFDDVEDMKTATNLIDGSFVETYGFYAKNDGGGAKYKVREVTNLDDVDEKKLIALLDADLVAELITDSVINVKQIGVYGDGDHDDKAALQYAIDNWDSVYIPSGTYNISETINLKDNLNLYGDGEKSVINYTYVYDDTLTYIFEYASGFMKKTTIENIKLTTTSEDNYCGGIKIVGALRGNSIKNVWFEKIAQGIMLDDNVWGLFDLENIFMYYFPSVAVSGTQRVGIYLKGNTINMRNIEILGKYYRGLSMYTASTINLENANISGSEEIIMTSAIDVIDSIFVNIENVWIEKVQDENGVNNTRSINVYNSNVVSLNNINCSNGSVWAEKSHDVKVQNVKYGNVNAGIRYNGGSDVTSDLVSCGYCNYQSEIGYSTGNVVIPEAKSSSLNFFNNEILLNGIETNLTATNAGLVTIASNTSTYMSGDRSLSVTASNYQGIKYTYSDAVVGKTYTVMAVVNTSTNSDYIYFTATNATLSNVYPATMGKYQSTWQVIKATFTVTENNPVFKIIVKCYDNTQNAVFLVDSFAIFDGFKNAEFAEISDKRAFMRNNKLYNSYAPNAGTWSKGDIVWNTFVSDSSVLYWKYNGSSWVAVNI